MSNQSTIHDKVIQTIEDKQELLKNFQPSSVEDFCYGSSRNFAERHFTPAMQSGMKLAKMIIIILHGVPGVGKSAILRACHKVLEDYRAASFLHDRGRVDCINPGASSKSFAWQGQHLKEKHQLINHLTTSCSKEVLKVSYIDEADRMPKDIQNHISQVYDDVKKSNGKGSICLMLTTNHLKKVEASLRGRARVIEILPPTPQELAKFVHVRFNVPYAISLDIAMDQDKAESVSVRNALEYTVSVLAPLLDLEKQLINLHANGDLNEDSVVNLKAYFGDLLAPYTVAEIAKCAQRLYAIYCHQVNGSSFKAYQAEVAGISYASMIEFRKRYRENRGVMSLFDRSSAPHQKRYRHSKEVEGIVIELAKNWRIGPSRICELLSLDYGKHLSRGVVYKILKRHGLSKRSDRLPYEKYDSID